MTTPTLIMGLFHYGDREDPTLEQVLSPEGTRSEAVSYAIKYGSSKELIDKVFVGDLLSIYCFRYFEKVQNIDFDHIESLFVSSIKSTSFNGGRVTPWDVFAKWAAVDGFKWREICEASAMVAARQMNSSYFDNLCTDFFLPDYIQHRTKFSSEPRRKKFDQDSVQGLMLKMLSYQMMRNGFKCEAVKNSGLLDYFVYHFPDSPEAKSIMFL